MEHSSLNWIQIPTKNLTRAASFYENVFDSSFFFEKLNDIPHAIFKPGRNGKKLVNGALIELNETEEIGLGPVLFFDATGDFETIMDLIKENGGEITHQKTLIIQKVSEDSYKIPDTYVDNKPGYYAHFKDSEGNRMGLYGSN
jgi:predicted enzyme related to lactoylglutathione lyase